MSETISVKNLGPIPDFTFKLDDYGLSVLTAPNGSGKSILLNAVQKAALGTGKLPLRDGQRRGSLEIGDCIITIGATTRYNGEFQIKNLESRLPLSALVDPGMKDAKAADRHRIKALVALTGVAATRDLFTKHEALADFNSVVTDDACRTDDLVEMAARVKRDYEAKAREAEKDADREEGHVRGLEESATGIDLEAESDAEQLQAEYDAARDAHTRLVAAIEDRAESLATFESAAKDLEQLRRDYKGNSVAAASLEVSRATARLSDQDVTITTIQQQIEELEARLETERSKQRELQARFDTLRSERDRAVEHDAAVTALRKTIADFTGDTEILPEPVEAQAAVDRAKAAQELGVKVREAIAKLVQVDAHKDAAAKSRIRAERLRSAATCVDEVLSDAIQSDLLKVDIQDGVARLVVDHHPRGEKVLYHELSFGERWIIALDIGVSRVGEGGLLVIEQEAYEGLDAFNRDIVHAYAKENRVFLLTAEATRDQSDGTELQARPYAATEGQL